MSELKTYKMVDEKYCADCVCVIPSEVYLKSEADKVIAHHKYKRCLAMAMWCEFYADSLRVKRNQCRYDEAELAETYYIRCRRYRRWCKVWMELAEKFKDKEAK